MDKTTGKRCAAVDTMYTCTHDSHGAVIGYCNESKIIQHKVGPLKDKEYHKRAANTYRLCSDVLRVALTIVCGAKLNRKPVDWRDRVRHIKKGHTTTFLAASMMTVRLHPSHALWQVPGRSLAFDEGRS